MSKLWTISGAGRGVGKTHLALKLCELLPNAIYAKCGHGKYQPGKPEHFFGKQSELEAFVKQHAQRHDHIIVEHNAWARTGRGDIIIFIGPAEGDTVIRNDAGQLQNHADIPITENSSIRNWRRVLRDKLQDHALCESVIDLLLDQKHHLYHYEPEIRCKLWIAAGDLHLFGSGLAKLLAIIDEHQTLRHAANAADMSYRHAWNLIKKAEKRLDTPLLSFQAGGKGGGSATLTSRGRQLLKMYRRLQLEVKDFTRQRFDQYWSEYSSEHMEITR